MFGIRRREKLTETQKNIIKQLTLFYEANKDIFKDFENLHEKREVIKRIYKILNYDRLPQLESTSKSEKNKGLPIYRGISAKNYDELKEYINQFLKGDIFYGGRASIYGTGIYTVVGEESSVAENYASDGDTNNIGIVIEIKMSSNSRIIDYNMIQGIRNFAFEQLRKMYNKKVEKYISFLEDDGVLASLLGYDAIIVKEKRYIVVLNRTKMIINDIDAYNRIDLMSKNKSL